MDRYRCELQGKFVWINEPFALFSGKLVWTNGAESSSKVSLETGIGPWMALPRKRKSKEIRREKKQGNPTKKRLEGQGKSFVRRGKVP